MRSGFSSPGRQKAQAMVVVLLFLTAMMLSLLVLFNTGQAARDKMEVQNAADAVAYSAAVLEARHLNFTAYTNRAMIANEVAIAQSIGMTTWLQKWGGTFLNLGTILKYLLSPIPVIGTALGSAIEAAFTAVGNAVNNISSGVAVFADGLSTLVSGLNTFYGYTQLGFRIGTYETILFYSNDIVEMNAPGARLANSAELMQFYNLYKFNAYNVSYKPTDAVSNSASNDEEERNREGMRRMAGAVNDSRDLWSRDRYNDELASEDEYTFSIPFLGKFGFRYKIGMFHAGGSALRFITGTGTNKDKEYYNWSSMDTNEFDLGLGIWLFGAYAGFDLPIPLGWGTMQMPYTSKKNKEYKLVDLPADGNKVGTAGYKADYGNTWDENEVTSFLASFGRSIYPYRPPETTTVKSYGDLAPYHDVDASSDPPPYIVWILQPSSNTRTSDNIGNASPTGALEIQNESGGGTIDTQGIQAIAGAEIYYKRTDGEDEEPNAFSPYWQARLTQVDKEMLIMAMLVHEPELAWAFTGINQAADSITSQLTDFASNVMDEMTDAEAIAEEAVESILDQYLP